MRRQTSGKPQDQDGPLHAGYFTDSFEFLVLIFPSLTTAWAQKSGKKEGQATRLRAYVVKYNYSPLLSGKLAATGTLGNMVAQLRKAMGL
jgi:hypothetical protein